MLFSFLKKYSIRMKTIRGLNILDKPGCFFMNMTNIDDFDPELLFIDDFAIFKDGSIVFNILYWEENNTPRIVFNNTVHKRTLIHLAKLAK